MRIGIIGYGSMGRMILEKLAESQSAESMELYISNRSYEKLEALEDRFGVCRTNAELASKAEIVFLCVRPADMRSILDEIKESLPEAALLVSLNGSIPFELLDSILDRKIAKVIPSVTAEVNESQTLVSYNGKVEADDKDVLRKVLGCLGNVIELPEDEIGMGSELVSCMPEFIASMFDVVCQLAKFHTSLSDGQIVQMVTNTLYGTGKLMLEQNLSFDQVVRRVATKGGITEEGSTVIYDMFPAVMCEVFEKTLEKRRKTEKKAWEAFQK
jgi:pyrroline-5-carboxylate reductase